MEHPNSTEKPGAPRLYPVLDTSGYSIKHQPTKPPSIKELSEKALSQIDWNPTIDFKQYLRKADKLRREGKECAARGDINTAFVCYAQAATLILEKLPAHVQYSTFLNETQRHNLALNGEEILNDMSQIKPLIVSRHEIWIQRNRIEEASSSSGLNISKSESDLLSMASSSTRDWDNARPSYGRPDASTMRRLPSEPITSLVPDSQGHHEWGGDRISESPSTYAMPEQVGRSWPISGNISFSDKLSSTNTEDLTRFVKRESEYPAHGGGYADVYVGTLMRKTRVIKVAIKVIRSHTYTADNRWKIDKRLKREIFLWSCLRHPNVVPLLGTTTGFGAYLSMVCPWMGDGNLSHYLSIKAHELNLLKRLHILADVVEGLVYLHSQSVIHGDLTTGNVLMDHGKALLSDFGLSNVMIEVRNNSFMSSTVSGSPRWTAPELLHVGIGVPEVTKHCDIYSFGSVMLQTITGRIPYENIVLDVQVLIEVMRGKTPTRPTEPILSDDLWDMILSCWSKDPNSRPDVSQIRERLHTMRYDFSEEELSANITNSDRSPGQDEEAGTADDHF